MAVKVFDKTVVTGTPKQGEISTTQIETVMKKAVIYKETLDQLQNGGVDNE